MLTSDAGVLIALQKVLLTGVSCELQQAQALIKFSSPFLISSPPFPPRLREPF